MTDLHASDTARRIPRWDGPTATFVAWATAVLPGVATLALLLGAGPAVAAGVSALFAAGAALARRDLHARHPHATLGACNVVTLTRMALVSVIAVAVVLPETLAHRPLALPALAALALSLDGLDGWLARRAGLTSDFGARFDMEVDVALAAVLAAILMRAGPEEGPLGLTALLVLGGTRYAFVLAAYALPWLRGDLPARISRKAVCVVQIATLGALLLPGWNAVAATGLATAAAGLLLWSFGRDVAWLARRA